MPGTATLPIDYNTPLGVRRILADHDVHTAAQTGWATLFNSNLLDAADGGIPAPGLVRLILSFERNNATPDRAISVKLRAPDSSGGENMLVVTTETIPGYRIVELRGQCFGVVVRSRGLGGNIMAGLRSIVGGEITEYTQLLEEARRHAVDRLVQNATAMGANAILMMRFDSSEIGQTMSEIVAYGTAAVVEPVPG
jgi:uncharacterized protein YbjQ (UPF0145 family)